MDNASPFPFEPSLRRFDRAAPAASSVRPGESGRLRQFARYGLAEIAYRGWQEASKWLDVVAPAGRVADPEALLREQAPDLAEAAAAIHIVRNAGPHRFFAGVRETETIGLLRERFPDAVRETVSVSEALLEHHFSLLGYPTLWFGDPIDWHLDPIRNRRAPMVPWGRLDLHDETNVGDSRVIWELNRQQWVVTLAQAYRLTGEERYAEGCIRAIDSWLEANPPGVGINWASSLEVALRLMSWCWTLLLVRESPAITGTWLMKLMAAVWSHANHIRRYPSFYFAPDTHLTGEALGLFYAGVLFPEFRDAARWRDVGADILISQSDAQIHADGVHFEQSTCYHRYTIETYLHFLLLAARNGMSIPQEVTGHVQQMLAFLLAVRQPDGSIPAIGDDDGGTLLPLTARSASDARELFALASAIFRRPEYSWAAESMTPEVPWLMGLAGVEAFDRVTPAQPGHAASSVFPSGGYAVMRTGWDSEAHHAIVDIGPLGCPISGGHGHADLLSVQCAIFGEPCLVDAGTCTYAAESQWRDFFRGATAHSTVMIDGRQQAEAAGPFGWRRHPRVRLREWHSNAQFDFLDAEHDGYASLGDPVIHRRRVIFVKPAYWLLVDDLSGAARHQVDLMFQFAPIRVTLGPHPWARAETRKGRVLWVSPFPSAPIQTSVKTGELAPPRGWISPDYGQRMPAAMLIYSCAVAFPWRIVTLLLPDRLGLPAPPSVRPLYDDAGLPTGFAFERPRRLIRFDDRVVRVERE